MSPKTPALASDDDLDFFVGTYKGEAEGPDSFAVPAASPACAPRRQKPQPKKRHKSQFYQKRKRTPREKPAVPDKMSAVGCKFRYYCHASSENFV